MHFKNEGYFEAHKLFNKREANFARTWAECIEVSYLYSGDLNYAISETDKSIKKGPLFDAALNLLADCWLYGQDLKSWYDNNTTNGELLIEI